MTGFNFITLLFCFPETKFPRHIQTQAAQPESKTLPNMEGNPKNDDHTVHFDQIENADKRVTEVGGGRPSKTQFKPWQAPDPRWKAFCFRDIVAPVYAFSFPIILWAGLNVAGPANILLYWNLTQSSVLGSPPYSFSPSAVGYSNFAFVVGIIGLATAGPFSDWITARATFCNNGLREAEMRLPALISYFATTVVGMVVGALEYSRQWDWPVILVVGYGFSGLCVTAVPTIAISYAVDCYKPISGEIMVVTTVIKNTCGFVMSYWVPPLAAREGWLVPTMIELSLTIGLMLLGIPLYYLGKRLRQLSRMSRVHLYEN